MFVRFRLTISVSSPVRPALFPQSLAPLARVPRLVRDDSISSPTPSISRRNGVLHRVRSASLMRLRTIVGSAHPPQCLHLCPCLRLLDVRPGSKSILDRSWQPSTMSNPDRCLAMLRGSSTHQQRWLLPEVSARFRRAIQRISRQFLRTSASGSPSPARGRGLGGRVSGGDSPASGSP